MKILIIGSTGFIGQNLLYSIQSQYPDAIIYQVNSKDPLSKIDEYTKDCDFVYHLAAVHRPVEIGDFDRINTGLLEYLTDNLKKHMNRCPVVYTSSIQAVDDTPYGRSKLAAEQRLNSFSEKNGNPAIIYRLSNTFGAHARPNAHSVVATFCYNISRDLPITINAPEHIMHLYHIDDVCASLLSHLTGHPVTPDADNIYRLPEETIYHISIQKLADYIMQFKRKECSAIPDEFEKRLYQTYLSYCPKYIK